MLILCGSHGVIANPNIYRLALRLQTADLLYAPCRDYKFPNRSMASESPCLKTTKIINYPLGDSQHYTNKIYLEESLNQMQTH